MADNKFKIKNGLLIEEGGINATGSLLVSGSSIISGSLQVAQGITGSLSADSTIGGNPVVDLYTAIAFSVAL